METLLQNLQSIHPLSVALVTYLQNHLKCRQIDKRDYLLKAGHICRNIYFIEKGLFRCFYLKGNVEVCSWFMKQGDVIASVLSFFNQTPSYESIQAVEESVVHYIEHRELEYIYRNFPEFNYVGRVLVQKYYMLSEQRLYSLRMQRGMERYDFLMQHHSDLILRVPAKYLASYLGISEAHLSVIKSRP